MKRILDVINFSMVFETPKSPYMIIFMLLFSLILILCCSYKINSKYVTQKRWFSREVTRRSMTLKHTTHHDIKAPSSGVNCHHVVSNLELGFSSLMEFKVLGPSNKGFRTFKTNTNVFVFFFCRLSNETKCKINF